MRRLMRLGLAPAVPRAAAGRASLPPSVAPSDLAAEPAGAGLSELEAMGRGPAETEQKRSRSPGPHCLRRALTGQRWQRARHGGGMRRVELRTRAGSCITCGPERIPAYRGSSRWRLTPIASSRISNRPWWPTGLAGLDDPAAGAASCAQDCLRRSRPLEDQHGTRKNHRCVASFSRWVYRFEGSGWRAGWKEAPAWR